jgi:hypothetical protein
VLLAVLPAFAGFAGIAWELSQLCGLAGFIGCILLAGASIRPRQARPRTLLALRAHALAGWLTLGAVVVHIVGLLLADPQVREYLKPSAPLYQMAGIGAGVLLIALTLTAIAAARRQLWSSHRGFQATHVTLSCGVLVLSAAHILATGRYAGNPWSRSLAIAAVVGGALMMLRARVFGRHSLWVAYIVGLTVIASLGLLVGGARAALREPVVRREHALPLDFPHTKHVEVACARCHHNFVDDRGLDGCIQCHRSERADLKVGIEARFHSFCFDCHRHPDASLKKHGPVSGCASCHRTPASL